MNGPATPDAVRLVATFSGITNLSYYLLQTHGYEIHLAHPAIAWISLCLAGISVLLFHDDLPYLYHGLQRLLRGSHWRPRAPAPRDVGGGQPAGAGFLVAVFESLDIPGEINDLLSRKPILVAVVLLGLFILQRLRRRANPRMGRLWGIVLRLPFRKGSSPTSSARASCAATSRWTSSSRQTSGWY